MTPPGWIVFPDKQGRFWELNTAMLIALVRAQVRAEFPPTNAGYQRLWGEVVLGAGVKDEVDVLMGGVRLPSDMASLVDRKVDLWIRGHRDNLLSLPDYYATSVLPELRNQAGLANGQLIPKLKDFSVDIVDHLRTVNQATASSTDKVKVEALLIEIGKVAIVTGVMVLPVGWAAAVVVGGSLAIGALKYDQTGSAGDAVVEGLTTAASALPGFKGIGVGIKLVAIGGSGSLSGVKAYRQSGSVGSAVITGSGEAVVAMIGLGTGAMGTETLAALRAGQITAAEARTSVIVLSGFKHGTTLTSGTLTGLVEGKQLPDAFYGATVSTLTGIGTDYAGKKVASVLSGQIARNTLLAPVVGTDEKHFGTEFNQKLVTKGLSEAADAVKGQLSTLLGTPQVATSPFVFAADSINQTLTANAFVQQLVLRPAR